jgi:hypothetical protein
MATVELKPLKEGKLTFLLTEAEYEALNKFLNSRNAKALLKKHYEWSLRFTSGNGIGTCVGVDIFDDQGKVALKNDITDFDSW